MRARLKARNSQPRTVCAGRSSDTLACFARLRDPCDCVNFREPSVAAPNLRADAVAWSKPPESVLPLRADADGATVRRPVAASADLGAAGHGRSVQRPALLRGARPRGGRVAAAAGR